MGSANRLSQSLRQNLLSTWLKRVHEITTMHAEEDHANPSFSESSLFPEFPWEKIPDKELKIVSKQILMMTVLDSTLVPAFR